MIASPLVEFFKRGEVARDVRLLAAQGGFAPRAHEQLSILVLLLEDPDPEVRQTADATLNRLPAEALSRVPGPARRVRDAAGLLRGPRHRGGGRRAG